MNMEGGGVRDLKLTDFSLIKFLQMIAWLLIFIILGIHYITPSSNKPKDVRIDNMMSVTKLFDLSGSHRFRDPTFGLRYRWWLVVF